MANQRYAKGNEKILSGSINLSSDTIKAVLVKNTYTADMAADEFYSTISAYISGSAVTLSGKSVTLGVFDAGDATFTAVPSGGTVNAVVIYKDTGNPATSPLLYRGDVVTGFPFAPNGSDALVRWSDGANKIFSI